MKKFLKIFLIFLYVIFALGFGNCQAYSGLKADNICNLQTIQTGNNSDFIFVSVPANDTSIASSNNGGYEISALKTDKETSFYNSEHEITNNNFLKQKYKIYTNKILNSKFRNISPKLTYEICTRAP